MPVRLSAAIIAADSDGWVPGLARGSDLLVLGFRHRRWLRRLATGSVARACARRARCPVMVVPEPSPGALQASLSADLIRGHRFR